MAIRSKTTYRDAMSPSPIHNQAPDRRTKEVTPLGFNEEALIQGNTTEN